MLIFDESYLFDEIGDFGQNIGIIVLWIDLMMLDTFFGLQIMILMFKSFKRSWKMVWGQY